MPKTILDDDLDVFLANIADSCDYLTICSTEPTTYTEARTTYKLAEVELDEGDGNGDYTIGDGDASGRKLTISEQADMSVTATGEANWVCLVKSGDTSLHVRTTCTAQNLTSGNTVTCPTWDIELADPT